MLSKEMWSACVAEEDLTQKTAFYLSVVNFVINWLQWDFIIYERFQLKENPNG